MTIPHGYKIGLTADGADAKGWTTFGDIGLGRLTEAGIEWETLPPMHDPDPALLDGFDCVLSFGHMPFGPDIARACPRLKHIARFGAGYDGIDVAALAAEGVVVTTTPEAVRRPVSTTALTLMLALATNLLDNHRVAASGDWSERGQHRGPGIAGRTVGIVGLGGIGLDFARLMQSFGVRLLGFNRRGATAESDALGVEIVDLATIARESDYVVLMLSLSDGTRGIIDRAFLQSMKPSAYVINVGRGGLVDQAALTEALASRQIAGAGLDVFDPEPPDPGDPLLKLDNVVLSPHALGWTADFTRDVSASVMESIIAVANGERAPKALDAQVYEQPWRAQQS